MTSLKKMIMKINFIYDEPVFGVFSVCVYDYINITRIQRFITSIQRFKLLKYEEKVKFLVCITIY